MRCRGVIVIPDSIWQAIPRSVDMALQLMVVAGLFAFPLLVILALFQKQLSPSRTFAVFAIEAGLSFAYFVALLPAIQLLRIL